MSNILTPLGRRVLVKREEAKAKVGLIHLPDAVQDKNQEATIVALGTGLDEDGRDVATLFTVKPGDRVLIAKYGGTDVQHNGEPHVLVSDLDILGIITPSGDGVPNDSPVDNEAAETVSEQPTTQVHEAAANESAAAATGEA